MIQLVKLTEYICFTTSQYVFLIYAISSLITNQLAQFNLCGRCLPVFPSVSMPFVGDGAHGGLWATNGPRMHCLFISLGSHYEEPPASLVAPLAVGALRRLTKNLRRFIPESAQALFFISARLINCAKLHDEYGRRRWCCRNKAQYS